MAAVRQDGVILEFALLFQTDREVVMAAVQQNGLALEFAPGFQTDREVVMTAVQQNGTALAYAPTLSGDPDIACAAIQNTPEALPFVDASLDKNNQFIECMMKYNDVTVPPERDELKMSVRSRQRLKTVAKNLPDTFKYDVRSFLGGKRTRRRKI
jgi:hypothetical protein